VLSPSDTAVVAVGDEQAAGDAAGLRAGDAGRLSAVPAAVATAEAGGNPCDNECAIAVGRGSAPAGGEGTISNLSNLVWLLTAELFDATTGNRCSPKL